MIKTAVAGIENMEDAFDDPTAYLVHCGYQEPEWLTKDLGSHWMMMDMLLVKHWPANVFVQTYAELATKLVTKCAFDPDQIQEIIVRPLPSGTGVRKPDTIPSHRHSSLSLMVWPAPCTIPSRAHCGISLKP